MLPDKSLPQGYIAIQSRNVAADNDPEQTRHKLRPDLMIVDMFAVEYGQYLQHATMAHLCPQVPNGKLRKVWVAVAGCCSETMYEE